jgi:hypothetical protein
MKNGRISVPLEMEADSALFVVFRKKYSHPPFIKISLDGKMIWNNDPLEFEGSISGKAKTAEPDPGKQDSFFPAPFTFRGDRETALKGLFAKNGEYILGIFNENAEENMTLYVDQCFQAPLDSSWKIIFPEGSGAPSFLEPEKLQSLSLNSDSNVRHFSGTCTWQTVFYLTDSDFIDGRKFILDLGRVEVSARVIINGADAGLAWKFPFLADITRWAVKGENILKVEVANTWFNRLVGDEQLPPENIFTKEGYVEKLPGWFVNNQSKSGLRKTFLTKKVVTGEEKLEESGLLGPVKLIFGVERSLGL